MKGVTKMKKKYKRKTTFRDAEIRNHASLKNRTLFNNF